MEQKSCLLQIEEIIKKEKPNVYIISGDIYHTSSPQTAAQEMLMEHLLEVHRIAPGMKVIITAGNHDSNRIEIEDPLWNLIGVSIIASIKRNVLDGEASEEYHRELFDRHIFRIGDEDSAIGFVVAIPHCYPGNFPSVKEGLPREERMKEFIALLLDEVTRRNDENLPVVLMAHTAVQRSGGNLPEAQGQDLEIIGGIDMIPEEAFGEGYDYIALGHIHYPQNISGRIRYCGSPLPLSFDEDFKHSISLVSIDAHGASPQVETIEIVNKMPIVTIPEQDRRKGIQSLPWEEARRRFEALDPELSCYVRLNVTDDGTIPVEAKDIAARIPEQRGLKARFCLINRIKPAREEEDKSHSSRLSLAELKNNMSPATVAELYLKDTGQDGLDTEILKLLHNTIDEVK